MSTFMTITGGSGSGPTTTREEKIKTIVDDIMEKLPDPFSMAEIMGKVEERTPYVIVAFQECERMNILTKEMRRSLKELGKHQVAFFVSQTGLFLKIT